MAGLTEEGQEVELVAVFELAVLADKAGVGACGRGRDGGGYVGGGHFDVAGVGGVVVGHGEGLVWAKLSFALLLYMSVRSGDW